MNVVMIPWKRFCVPSVIMNGGSFNQLIRAALIAPNTIPKAIEQIAAKRKLLMPDEIMIFIVV